MSIAELTIPRLVQASAQRFGTRQAVEDGDVRLTFDELARACEHTARAFCAAGIQPGDRVAVWAPNIYEWILAAVGLHAAGGVLVPLNTRLKGGEAGYILAKSGARMLFTVGEFLGIHYVDLLRTAMGGAGAQRPVKELPALEQIVMLRGEAEGATAWAEFVRSGKSVSADEAQRRLEAVSPQDLADLMFTSGTTGKPKGVMSTHEQNVRAFDAWSEVIGLRAGDRYLIVNPFFHSFGYKAGWLAAIMRGATILPHQVFDVDAVLQRIDKDQVSVMPGPPTLFQSILLHPDRSKYNLSTLRLVVTGAAVIPVELVERLRRELRIGTVITGYGLTEASGVVTMCREGDDAETIARTSGRAIPGVEVRCIDAQGHEVPRGQAGEVVVRGYNVMKGYFEDPAATAESVDADGWLHTGDVGIMDEHGNLRITDRIKDMFIMGGFNCYPAEIENIMLTHEGIAQAAVIGVPDERMGEVGMAFVVPRAGASLSPEATIKWCREHMANYKVPRFVKVVDALPMNASGKVTKFVLREQARQQTT